MPKAVKRSLQASAILGGLLLLLAGGLLVRLAAGPLALDPLVPWLAARAQSALPGLQLAVEGASLAWDPRTGEAAIGLSGVSLKGPGGRRLAMPRLNVICEAWPLLFGEVRPSRIQLGGATAVLAWEAGPIATALGLGGDAVPADGEGAAGRPAPTDSRLLRLPEAARDWLDRTSRDRLLAGLERIEIGFSSIRLEERGSGTIWRLPELALTLARAGTGWRIEGGGLLLGADGSAGADLDLTAHWRPGAETPPGAVDLTAGAIDLPALAAGIPALAPLSGLEMPMRAELAAGFDRAGALAEATLSLTADTGRIAWPGLYPEPRMFDSIAADLAYDPARRHLTIARLAAEFAGARLRLSGHAAFPPGEAKPRLRLSGGWDRLKLEDLTHYWPRGMAASGRRWIEERIPAGAVHDAELQVDLAGEGWTASPMPASAFHLDFAFSGLDSYVLPPAPPLAQAAGTARLTADRLTIALSKGSLFELPVAGSTVVLSDLDDPETQWGDVRLVMTGPLPQLLRLIDHEPMGYASAFGIDPADVTGEAALEAALRFPLINDLPLEGVELDIAADIEGFAIPDLVAEHGFTDGRLTLAVDNAELSASGSGRFADVPIDVTWRERFAPEAGAPPSRYVATARLGADDVARLFADPAPYFAGAADLEVTLEGSGPDLARGRVEADLAASELAFPALAWEKPAGRPGRLGFDVDFDALGETVTLANVAFESEADRFRGTVLLDADSGALRRAEIGRLQLGRTAVSGQFARTPEGGVSVDLSGPALDLSGFLEDLPIPDRPGEEEGQAPPFDIFLGVETLHALADVAFENVTLAGRREDGFWQSLSFDASLGESGPVTLELGPAAEANHRAVKARAGDTGRLLSSLGLFDLIAGGELALDGHLEGTGAQAIARGRILLRDFEIRPDPKLDAALESEERSRLQELIGEDGVAFDELYLPFSVANGVIDIEDGRANGSEVGLTLEGQLDQGFERINVNGVIVPAYFFNSLLGRIPIIGDIFTGGSGGGLFALSYRLQGDLSDPDFSINPMTAIMPGILRKPFEGRKGAIEAPGEEEEPGDEERPKSPPPGQDEEDSGGDSPGRAD